MNRFELRRHNKTKKVSGYFKLVMSTASNPQIAVITHMEKKILESFSKGDYMLVLRQIANLLSLIRKSHRDKELLDKIIKEYNSLKGNTESKREKYTQNKVFEYNEWFGEAMQILYVRGYLVDQGYTMVYPSELDPSAKYISPLLQRP